MRLMLDVPGPLLERIYEEVGVRSGFSMRSFILTAIENQLQLESGTLAEAEETHGGSNGDGPVELPGDLRALIAHPEPSGGSDAAPVPAGGRADVTDADGTPWVWGQVNRVFPIKFVVRVLANAGDGKGIPLEEAGNVIAKASRSFGLFLAALDERAERGRVDRLSVGFPTSDAEKDAVSRFCSHFFGERRGDGRISGAAFMLGLVGLFEDGTVGLTEAGASFACLGNPLLDGSAFRHPTLSEEEIDLYLGHCRQSATGEAKAFAVVLSGLLQGYGSNEDLNLHIASGVGRDWTKSMVSTQRSGTMGRMLELGLIERHREGRRVRFEMTDRGRVFLEEWDRSA